MKGVRKRLVAAVAAIVMGFTLIPSSIANAETQTKEASVETKGVTETVQRKFVAYFPEWAYKNEQNEYYTVDRMPWDKMTHINYAFAHVDQTTNKIAIGDKKAALEEDFPGVTSDFPYKGHFNVLNSYKKKYPNVKTMISVGGWAESTGFYTMTQTAEGRETFANSVVDFLRTYGFDGVDIDYEYPTNLEDAGNPIDFDLAKPYRANLYTNYVAMMKLLREKVDEASAQDGKQYLLTAAVTASAWVVSGMGEENYAQYLDYINLMTYDFHGSWNGFVAHNSPLYSDPRDCEIQYWNTGYNYLSTDWAVKYYSGIMDPSKIVIGIPYYTRGWENVTPSTLPGGLYGSAWGAGKIPDAEGTGATGIDNIWHDDLADGSEEPGGSNPLWHVKNLLADKSLGYERYWDDVSKVPYVWNESKKVWLSFEDEQSMAEKVDYVIDNNLGGVMVWEIDGDFDQDETGKYVVGDTLTTIAYDKFKEAGPLQVEEKVNTLPLMDYDIEVVNNYDHPSNEFKVNLINNTGKEIAKPCTIEFDLPNCIYFKTEPWASGATIKREERGMYMHFTLTLDQWGISLPSGTTTIMEGNMTLRPLGGAKNMVVNGYASKAEWDRIGSQQPSLLSAAVSASTTDSRDGNYTITVSVPENSKGTSFDLYEGDKVIKTETVTNAAKKFTYNMTNKANGTYDYKVVMKNEGKQIESSVVSVYVGPEIKYKKPVLSVSETINGTGSYTVKVNVPADSNGKTVDVYEGDTKIASETLTGKDQIFTYEIKDKTTGTYSYKAILRNGGQSVESDVTSVQVIIKETVETYDSNKSYTFGDVVAYNGYKYESQGWWVTGITPGTNDSIWKPLGPVSSGVTILDLAKMAQKYNLTSSDSSFDSELDLNNDKIIDIFDLVLLAKQIQ